MCATYWPPAIMQFEADCGNRDQAALLGTTKRSDGSKQLTYNHHPLYGFALDKQAGQTNGQGQNAFGGRWWAVSARGSAVTKSVDRDADDHLGDDDVRDDDLRRHDDFAVSLSLPQRSLPASRRLHKGVRFALAQPHSALSWSQAD